jgi:hypothetical protein
MKLRFSCTKSIQSTLRDEKLMNGFRWSGFDGNRQWGCEVDGTVSGLCQRIVEWGVVDFSRSRTGGVVVKQMTGLHAERMRGQDLIPDRLKRFLSSPEGPDRIWGPPSLVLNGYRGLSSGIRRSACETDHSAPSRSSECLELYLHFPICIHGVVLKEAQGQLYQNLIDDSERATEAILTTRFNGWK